MPNPDLIQTVWMLTRCPDEQFAALVNEDLRATRHGVHANPVLHDALRSEEVIDRTWAQLTAIDRKVQGDLAYRRAQCEALDQAARDLRARDALPAKIEQAEAQAAEAWSEYYQWKPRTLRFRSQVDGALTQVRVRRDEVMRNRIDPEELDKLRKRVNNLESGIRNHRDAVEPTEATPDDHALWALVS
jgi:hypothetical protein